MSTFVKSEMPVTPPSIKLFGNKKPSSPKPAERMPSKIKVPSFSRSPTLIFVGEEDFVSPLWFVLFVWLLLRLTFIPAVDIDCKHSQVFTTMKISAIDFLQV